MEALQGLISEAKSIPNPKSERVTQESQSDDNKGVLLIIGYNDWDVSVHGEPKGLNNFHIIPNLRDVRAVYSATHSVHFFIDDDVGGMYCMGRNDCGQLGIGELPTQHLPHPFPSLEAKIVKIATGRSHSLFLLENGKVYGCGSNMYGQLGLGDNKVHLKNFCTPTLLPLRDIIDIGAGENFSIVCNSIGRVYTFGHPEYGQCGTGNTGEYMRDTGQKGPKIQYNYITSPYMIKQFLTKDHTGKIHESIPAEMIKIRKVSAGKNHAICIEDWEGENHHIHINRVYSWGFGGYGRLGHNDVNDEYIPRHIEFYNPPNCQRNPGLKKNIREVIGGYSYTLAVSANKVMYYTGKIQNAQGDEATIYPKIPPDLIGFKIHSCNGQQNALFVIADNRVVAWGAPLCGRMGFETLRSSRSPAFVTELNDLKPLQVSCGYGHTCVVVSNEKQYQAKLKTFPILQPIESSTSSNSSSSSSSNIDKEIDEEETGNQKSNKNHKKENIKKTITVTKSSSSGGKKSSTSSTSSSSSTINKKRKVDTKLPPSKAKKSKK